LRAQIADLLRSEIESLPGREHRLLRPCRSTEIRANFVLYADEVAENEGLLDFVGKCRHFTGKLALNEMTQGTTFSEIQQFLDNGTGALLDGLCHAGTADRSFRQSQVDAAVRVRAKVFGAEYAALLTKTSELASAAERKVAQAG
jgi:hypothetical protein